MLQQNYEVEVIINGKPAKEYAHKSKIYIEGRKGTKFSIRIRNNSYSRKLFVPTIDGLSVMNGEEGKFDSGGYIVQGYSSITIDGWRTSDKEVASFYFSSPEGSYRKQMKRGDNLGIIGVAVFEELSYTTTFITQYPYPSITVAPKAWFGFDGGATTIPCGGGSTTPMNYRASDDFNSAQAINCSAGFNSPNQAQSVQQLGTGFGEQKNSEVISVNFERVHDPSITFEIYYNTREELEKEGVNFKKEPLYVTPQAFPGNYCKPPRN